MGRFARRFLRSACLNEVFCPVGHGRREKVGPAGKGPAYQKAVESDAVFLVHADARREREAAGGFRATRSGNNGTHVHAMRFPSGERDCLPLRGQ